MEEATTSANPIVFDLSPIKPSERFEFWHDVGSLIQRPIRTEATSGDRLYVRADLLVLNEIVTGRMTASGQLYERTSEMIRRDDVDNYLLCLVESGSVMHSSQSCEQIAQPGDLILIDHSESSFSQWSAHSQIYAGIPRILLPQVSQTKPGTQVLRSGSAPAVILGQYLQSFWQLHRTQTLEDNLRIMKGLACLTQLYFGNLERPIDPYIGEEDHQALLDTIKRWINSQLHRHDLNPEEICTRFHMSRSSLYALFHPDGGVRAYVQTCRLTKARHILEATDNSIAVNTIARRLGFTSHSSFTRAFTNHWGLTPREARERADFKGHNAEPRSSEPQLTSVKELKSNSATYYNAIRGRGREK
jgi:AraC-like DNA-binding protein